jgi:phosphoesterase RecJ-like protein
MPRPSFTDRDPQLKPTALSAAGHHDAMHAILDAIAGADSILVSSHARPDGDAIGSMLACGMLLDQLGKRVDLALADRVPMLYRWLPCSETIRHLEKIEADYDLVTAARPGGTAAGWPRH